MERRRIITLDIEDRVRALGRISLLEGCSERVLEHLATCAHMLSFAPGDVIVPEGEEGLGFYLVLSGSVVVTRDGVEIRHLSDGDFFGEISLLEGEPRKATVVADGPVTCLGILRSDFKPLLVRNPRLALRILDEEARRERELAEAEERAREI